MKKRGGTNSGVRPPGRTPYLIRLKQTWPLYVFLLPCLIYYIVFKYAPIYGIQIAFRDYKVTTGFWNSEWVGLKYFLRFFRSADCWKIIQNTLTLSILNILVTFPIPILFALMVNQVGSLRFKRVVQTISYAPYFISVVVLVGMIKIILSPSYGLVNHIITFLGGESIFFMARPELFKWIYVISAVWQNTGYSSIIYIAALSNVSPELHEAAIIDGATKWQRVIHIDLPAILPTIIIMLILSTGQLLSVGYEKVYLLQNTINQPASEIISTFVYKRGLQSGEFSYATAINLFQSVINVMILLTVNKIAKKVSDSSLF